MELRNEILRKLKIKGYSIKSAAFKTGVSYSSLQRYFSHENDISSEKILKILSLIDIDVEEAVMGKSVQSKIDYLPGYLKKSILKVIGG